jgi:hypothetical protein
MPLANLLISPLNLGRDIFLSRGERDLDSCIAAGTAT